MAPKRSAEVPAEEDVDPFSGLDDYQVTNSIVINDGYPNEDNDSQAEADEDSREVAEEGDDGEKEEGEEEEQRQEKQVPAGAATSKSPT